uniref:Cytochrome c, somatic n=1 Tax=Rousettus aegyptiacus TaxID=9407 RepID=A0A7J8D517_ROUAE|nr:cytochrome c, somatic [Rousettus aegyptiacus]
MLRRARRFLFRSVPSAILWKREASTRLGQISMVCLGERQVRPLDFLTRMPTRTKASPGERRH